jgi:N-acetylglucosamine kinase-like BadF-type ATPase
VKIFLGVDGGGSKTEFVLIDDHGNLLATHQEGPAYHPEIGLDALQALMQRGIAALLAQGGVTASAVTQAFIGVPAYGEDSRLVARLDAVAAPLLAPGQYRCGNDVVCGWAGALACTDGISVVAGTGSIAYGEFAGRTARAGGWGELFSDEGSAYWIAREGLNLFSRMSDGRAAKGPLYDILRAHFELDDDLDLCAAIYGANQSWRSRLAQLARSVAEAAHGGDAAARAIFTAGARELAGIVAATRLRLAITAATPVAVSYSGSMFRQTDLLLEPMKAVLEASGNGYRVVAPRLPPGAGAALYAARSSGAPLGPAALARLEAGCRGQVDTCRIPN